MLKRCQILLSEWQLEYIKAISDKFDYSFSEIIRSTLCIGYLHALSNLDPKYKHCIDPQFIRKLSNVNISQDERYKLLSKLYFETRKATEQRADRRKK